MLNYFNFKKFNGQYLLTNDFGRYIFLNPDEFRRVLNGDRVEEDAVQHRLEKNAFVYDSSLEAFLDDNLHHLRNAKRYLFQATQLHIFVVTTACNLHCVYCQAQNGTQIPNGFMTKEVAKKAVDLALQSPAKSLQFEFQGGEPLMNFEVIKYIVNYAKENAGEKEIAYSIVSNLTLLTEGILQFIQENQIELSTSLDGDSTVHNWNRPCRSGQGSYDLVNEKINAVKCAGVQMGAIETTTRESLAYPENIVDEYVQMGFHSISLRALTPLGCAHKRWEEIGYQPAEFLTFYRKAFDHIIEINQSGYRLTEGIATIFLKKIIEGIALNYMELRSPCGAAMGQIAYYYNGNVYTCDEGRMIAEMGNDTFLLGTVESTYNELMGTKVCRAACTSSILEALLSCSDCVYQPYCGVCPAVNYALYGDLYEKTSGNYRCQIYRGMLDIIFEKLQEDDYSVRQIFRSWIS